MIRIGEMLRKDSGSKNLFLGLVDVDHIREVAATIRFLDK
jgi:hypothetical protein